MNIVISTTFFAPSIGGIETIMGVLAEQFQRQGHSVIVITDFPEGEKKLAFSYEVVRRPSWRIKWKLLHQADVILQANVSLKEAGWLLLFHRKWIISHHCSIWYDWKNSENILSHLKRFVTRFTGNIAVSDFVGKNLRLKKYIVIKNAYNNILFECAENQSKRDGLVFVGRLVDEKGIQLLLEAYAILQKEVRQKKIPDLYIIGDGSEGAKLKTKFHDTLWFHQQHWLGALSPKDVSKELRKHSCMIIPSCGSEAFGIVALEGIASGCDVIVSDSDGLYEAIGDCGETFRKGDVTDLVKKMKCYLNGDYKKISDEMRKEHLKNFTPQICAEQYLKAFSIMISTIRGKEK